MMHGAGYSLLPLLFKFQLSLGGFCSNGSSAQACQSDGDSANTTVIFFF